MQLHCHSFLLLLIKLIDFPIKRHILRFIVLSHPTHANWVQIVLWEFLAADVEGIEGIGAIGKGVTLSIDTADAGSLAEFVLKLVKEGGICSD